MSTDNYIEQITDKGLMTYTMSLPKIWLLIALSTLHHAITVGTPFCLIFMMSQLWFIDNPITYIQLALGFVIIGALWMVTSYVKDIVFYNLLFKYSNKLSSETIKLLLDLPYSYTGNLPVESQFTRFNPLENLSYIWLNGIIKPLLDLPLVIIAFSIICYILGFTYFCYIAIILSLVITFNIYKSKSKNQGKQKISTSVYHGTLKDIFNNMGLIQSHHRSEYFNNKTNEMMEEKILSEYITSAKSSVLSNISESILLLLYIGSLTFSVYYALSGTIDVKLLIVILLLTWFSIAPFKTILSAFDEIPKAKELVKQFANLGKVNSNIQRHKKQELDENFDGNIILNNVSSSYPGGKFILNNISFNIRRGQLLVINGASGSGKSTLLKIISGLNNQFTGSLLIDQDTTLLDSDSLENHIIYLNQDSYFDNLSIKDNIKLNHELNDNEDINQTIQSLAFRTEPDSNTINKYPLYEFKNINSSKISFDEITNKITLSKINSNIKNKIILLDEPLLNNIDNDFEYLANTIRQIKPYNTIIIVSRYNFYAPLADKIIMLNNGRIEQEWKK